MEWPLEAVGGGGGGINSGMCTCGIRHLLERKDNIDFKLYPSITRKSYKCTSNLESLGFLKRIDFSIVNLYRTMQDKWFKFDKLYV